MNLPQKLSLPLSRPTLALACALLGLYAVACVYLQAPYDTFGDAPGYLEAMRVMNGTGEAGASFTPNRILTTFASTGSVALLALVTGNYFASWFFVNTLYFFGLGFVCYLLFRRITGSAAGSILGALFVVGNYDVLVFGLNYLMDISGWFWFALSLLFLWRHIETGESRFLWHAALIAGVGGLFKEYAYLAFVPAGLYVLCLHARAPRMLLTASLPFILALVPTFLVHAGVYLIYGYSYLDWYGMNARTFGWEGWAGNAARSFLVSLSFLAPVAALGAFAFAREMRRAYDAERILFILALVPPALAVLLWPIITERFVFMIVPLAGLMAAYAVKRYERHWPWFGFVWLLYVLLALTTDGLILNALYGR